jgi:hypothetical protein
MYIVTAETIKTDLQATKPGPLSIASAGISGVSKSFSGSNQRSQNINILGVTTSLIDKMFPVVKSPIRITA